MVVKRGRKETYSSCGSSEEEGRRKKKVHNYFLRSQKMKTTFAEDDANLFLKELKDIRVKGKSIDWKSIAKKLKMKTQQIGKDFYFSKIEEVSLFSRLIDETDVEYDSIRDNLTVPCNFWKDKHMKKKYKRFKKVNGVANFADWYSFKNFIPIDNYSSVSHKRSYGVDGQTSAKRCKSNLSVDVNSKDEIVPEARRKLKKLYNTIKHIEEEVGRVFTNGNHLREIDLFVLLDFFEKHVNDAQYFLDEVQLSGQHDEWPKLEEPLYMVKPLELMPWLHRKLAQANVN